MHVDAVIEISDMVNPPARIWADGWLEGLLQDALAHGSMKQSVTELGYKLIIELQFPDPDAWRGFLEEIQTVRAFGQVPDQDDGLEIYIRRGDESGDREPRTQRPLAGAPGMTLEPPEDQ